MDLLENSSGQVRHPWEDARFAFFLRLLQRSLDLEKIETILDVGSGDAWFAEQLTRHIAHPRITCWDSGYTPAVRASDRLPRSERLAFSATRPMERFPLVILLDVLEHVEHDLDFLTEIVRDNMVSGSHVLISVPAWPSLFSSHDVRLRHYRRYSAGSARQLITSAGLCIIRSAGLFYSPLAARLLQVLRERITGWSPRNDLGSWQRPTLTTTLTRAVLTGDSFLSVLFADLGVEVPGLSWWALCRRQLQ